MLKQQLREEKKQWTSATPVEDVTTAVARSTEKPILPLAQVPRSERIRQWLARYLPIVYGLATVLAFSLLPLPADSVRTQWCLYIGGALPMAISLIVGYMAAKTPQAVLGGFQLMFWGWVAQLILSQRHSSLTLEIFEYLVIGLMLAVPGMTLALFGRELRNMREKQTQAK